MKKCFGGIRFGVHFTSFMFWSTAIQPESRSCMWNKMEFTLENFFVKIIFSWKSRYSRKEGRSTNYDNSHSFFSSSPYFRNNEFISIPGSRLLDTSTDSTAALSQTAFECVGCRGSVCRECCYQGKESRTPCRRQASTCSVHPEQSGDWSRVVPRGRVQHQASLPGYKGAEGAGQPAGREHPASQSLWVCPLRAGLLDSSILARRVTAEKDGTVVLYLEHVLV